MPPYTDGNTDKAGASPRPFGIPTPILTERYEVVVAHYRLDDLATVAGVKPVGSSWIVKPGRIVKVRFERRGHPG